MPFVEEPFVSRRAVRVLVPSFVVVSRTSLGTSERASRRCGIVDFRVVSSLDLRP